MAIASLGGPVLVVASSRVERSALGLAGPARGERSACLVGRGAAWLLVELVRVDVAGMGAGAVFGSAAFAAGSGEVLALVLVVASAAVVELGARVVASPAGVDVAGFGAAAVLGRALVAAGSGEVLALVLVVASAAVVGLGARVDVAGMAAGAVLVVLVVVAVRAFKCAVRAA